MTGSAFIPPVLSHSPVPVSVRKAGMTCGRAPSSGPRAASGSSDGALKFLQISLIASLRWLLTHGAVGWRYEGAIRFSGPGVPCGPRLVTDSRFREKETWQCPEAKC